MPNLYRGALGASALLALAATPAVAHITLETIEAARTSFAKLVLRVPHGCDGAATTAITVTIPEGIIGAKPMPKPGWTLTIAKGAYAKTYAFLHGTLAAGAKTVTWSGGELPDDEYDEFVVSAYVSDAMAPGSRVAIPVVQTCKTGEVRWVDPPGADPHAGHPAPVLTIGAPMPPGPHH